jgi:hypothetical protein
MIINPDVDWEDASHGFRQELAAIALSHRGAHTLQCAAPINLRACAVVFLMPWRARLRP